MQPSGQPLSAGVQAQSVELLDSQLARASVLHTLLKHFHGNERGAAGAATHQIFCAVMAEIGNHCALIAERSRALGSAGPAHEPAAEPPCAAFPPFDAADGLGNAKAISGALAAYRQDIQPAIAQAASLGDLDTADRFTEISRYIDQQLWFVESLLASEQGTPLPRARARA